MQTDENFNEEQQGKSSSNAQKSATKESEPKDAKNNQKPPQTKSDEAASVSAQDNNKQFDALKTMLDGIDEIEQLLGKNENQFNEVESLLPDETPEQLGALDKDKYEQSKREHLSKRDESYTALLSSITNIYKVGHEHKEEHKWEFFDFMQFIMMASLISPILIVISLVAMGANEMVVAIIGAFVSIITAIIAIPTIIAKYLFDPAEDKHLAKMLVQLHKHDRLKEENLIKPNKDVGLVEGKSDKG